MIEKRSEVPAKYYQFYSVKHFDKYNCVKLSVVLYLSILWLVRGYAIWLVSVTNMQDRVAILQWFYPQQNGFYASLCSGFVGLFPLLLISFRKPDAKQWVRWCWRYIKLIMVIVLLIDISINILFHWVWPILTLKALYFDILISGVFMLLTITSKRIFINSREFPEKIESDK